MSDSRKSSPADARLHEMAAILRRSFALPTSDLSPVAGGLNIPDLLLALDSPELREIMSEIRALHQEQVHRLERLLSRHADNDS